MNKVRQKLCKKSNEIQSNSLISSCRASLGSQSLALRIICTIIVGHRPPVSEIIMKIRS